MYGLASADFINPTIEGIAAMVVFYYDIDRSIGPPKATPY